MLETLVLTLVCAALISMTSFEVWSGVQPIPLLCLLVGSAILCGMDHWLGGPLSKHMEGRGKLILALTGGVLAALVVFAVAAYNTPGRSLSSAERDCAGPPTRSLELIPWP